MIDTFTLLQKRDGITSVIILLMPNIRVFTDNPRSIKPETVELAVIRGNDAENK